jgi:hypothetical protein
MRVRVNSIPPMSARGRRLCAALQGR